MHLLLCIYDESFIYYALIINNNKNNKFDNDECII